MRASGCLGRHRPHCPSAGGPSSLLPRRPSLSASVGCRGGMGGSGGPNLDQVPGARGWGHSGAESGLGTRTHTHTYMRRAAVFRECLRWAPCLGPSQGTCPAGWAALLGRTTAPGPGWFQPWVRLPRSPPPRLHPPASPKVREGMSPPPAPAESGPPGTDPGDLAPGGKF